MPTFDYWTYCHKVDDFVDRRGKFESEEELKKQIPLAKWIQKID